MKKLAIVVIILLIGCQEEKKAISGLADYVPNNAFCLLKINDFAAFKNDIRNNHFLNQFEATKGYKQFENFIARLHFLNADEEILLCFNEVGKSDFNFTFITKKNGFLFNKEGLNDLLSVRYVYENTNIDEITIKGQLAYHATINETVVISSSKLLVENIIRQLNSSIFKPDASLSKILASANSKSTASLFINSKKSSSFLKSLLPGNTFVSDIAYDNWLGLDADISQNEISLHGITIPADSLGSALSVFENLQPTENLLPKITPVNAKGLVSFTYDDWDELKDNLKKYQKQPGYSTKLPEIMPFSNEAGIIYTNEGEVAALHFTNVEGAVAELELYSATADTHRSVEIKKLETFTLLVNNLAPLINNLSANFYAVLDDFIIFGANLPQLYSVIDNYQNTLTLQESTAFEELKEELNDESSVLFIGINPEFQKTLKKQGDRLIKQSFAEKSFKNYPFMAAQFVGDKGFLHTNALIKKIKPKNNKGTVSQLFTVALEAEVANKPQFIKNHRTDQKDIVIQDKLHHLYLISNEGKIRWKKKLDGPIIGLVSQVDLYKNGRLQLAFNTEKKLYIVDLKSNDVSPFPIAFDTDAKLSLAVFDYDKIKNYRFVVCGDQKVFMYNSSGNLVEGFTYKKSKDTLTNHPVHFRVAGKDYLVFTKANEMAILDRRGKKRVKVKGNIALSGNKVYLYKDLLTTTDNSGNLVQVDFKGNIKRTGLGLQENHKIVASSKTLVSISDNILNIKGKAVELDYGIYTAPQLFYVNNKIYISVTDLQTSKIYLFDSQGKNIANFPVYGNSAIDLDDVKSDKKIAIVSKGEANSLIVYGIN